MRRTIKPTSETNNHQIRMDAAQYLLVSLPELANALDALENGPGGQKRLVSRFALPDFQIKTLDQLVQISEEVSKIDGNVGLLVAKVVDILEQVEPRRLYAELRQVNKRPATNYLEQFLWNLSKYRLDKPIKELMETLLAELALLDNDVRLKHQQYQTARLNFAAADRKRNGDLLVKLLHDIVQPSQFVLGLEHLTTVLVAVPKNLVADFVAQYETASEFVIPRSAQEIARDADWVLYSVVVFKKSQAAFLAAARDRKWHPRLDFVYLEESLNEMRKEYDLARAAEAKAKNDLLRLASTAYSEIFAAWLHIKAIRIYVESVLRYGLPPQFDCFLIRFHGPSAELHAKKAKKDLVAKFGYLGGDVSGSLHEYASLVDDYEPFVLYSVVIV